MQKYRPIILIVLDGWGLSPSWGGNALVMNNPKNIDKYWREYPHKILQALGAIEYGNIVGESRLGHMMMGSGRTVVSNHTRINNEIKSKKLYKNQVLLNAFDWAKKNKSNLHLVGMISEGGVHSDISHLNAILQMAHELSFKNVYIHAISDGTDSGPTDALSFVAKINKKIAELNLGSFASVSGRTFAMDRSENWDKTRKVYDCLTQGKGIVYPSIEEAISENYRQGKNDEYIEPGIIKQKNGELIKIKENDAVVFFNFREDRMIQITKVFSDPKFKVFLWNPKKIKNLYIATMINYQNNLAVNIILPDVQLKNTLSEVLAKSQYKQLKIAESEKKSHVTKFFNGKEDILPYEDVKIISSSNVTSFDQKPEMEAYEITESIIKAIKSKKYDFILANFANVDMVAHSGNILATGKAVQVLDEVVDEIVRENLKYKGATIITADHGNAEQMISVNARENKDRETQHTLNPVPFILVMPDNKKDLIKTSIGYKANTLSKIMSADSTLADIAPTVLEITGIPKPVEMTGKSLLSRLE